jgi:hypothetical protein
LRPRALLLLALALLALAADAAAASAQELPLSLLYWAPNECPSEADVLAETRAMVESRPPDAETHVVYADVRVEALPGGHYQALIRSERDGVRGERTLTDPRCSELAHAVALVLALSLGADALAPEPVLPPTAAPPATEPALTVVTAPEVPAATSPFGEPVHLAAGTELVAGSGGVPGVGFGAGARAFMEVSGTLLELRMAVYWPKAVAIAGSDDARARFLAAQVGVAGCYGSPMEVKVGVLACGGGELAWARGKSSGVSDPDAAHAFWPRLFLGLALRAAVPRRILLRLEGQGVLALFAPRFAVGGRGAVYEPETLGFRVTLGAEKHF